MGVNLKSFVLGFIFCLITFSLSFCLFKYLFNYNRYISSYPNHDLNISRINETCEDNKYCKLGMINEIIHEKVNYTPDGLVGELVRDWNKSDWKDDCDGFTALAVKGLKRAGVEDVYWVEQPKHICYAIRIDNTIILENCNPNSTVERVIRYEER